MEKKPDFENLVNQAKSAALLAGKEINTIYHLPDFEVQEKSDQSPLTLADQIAHQIIYDLLLPLGFPILSEEGQNIPYSERKIWPFFWLVDPLDGTKEFIRRNGEFTVNIAFIQADTPIFGVVYAPVLNKLYWNLPGEGAWLETDLGLVSLTPDKRSLSDKGLKIVASRSHLDQKTQAFIDRLVEPELLSMGSSLKFMLLAEGLAHFYPRFAPTMEWDTAAAQAILCAVGGQVLNPASQNVLRYNKPDLRNPDFLAQS